MRRTPNTTIARPKSETDSVLRDATARAYNDRSEVVSAQIGTNRFDHVYDFIGNVTKYIDEVGNVVSAYEYDDFGRLVARSGPLADFFRHRFSTKYYDAETGLCYYGYRFFSPALMRWLNRDPIEEEGGLNLYGFCGKGTASSSCSAAETTWLP